MKINKRVGLVITAFLVLALTISVYYIVSAPTKKIDRFTQESYKVKLILIHANWCGHCTRYLNTDSPSNSIWITKLPNALKEKKLEASVMVVPHEETEFTSHEDLAERYGVNSFPTIIGENVVTGKVERFNGNRDNVDELIAFAQSLL